MSPRTNIGGLSRPDFLIDPGSADRVPGVQIEWDEVADTYRETPATDATVDAIYAIGATTVGLSAALENDVPAGARFVLADGTKTFRTTAAAQQGALSLTVAPLAEATAAGEVYTYEGGGKKTLPHGTPLAYAADGVKYVEAGDVAAGGGAGEARGLLEGPAIEDDPAAPLTGYGMVIGGVVYEELIPGITDNMKAALNANGTGMSFRPYTDTRAS